MCMLSFLDLPFVTMHILSIHMFYFYYFLLLICGRIFLGTTAIIYNSALLCRMESFRQDSLDAQENATAWQKLARIVFVHFVPSANNLNWCIHWDQKKNNRKWEWWIALICDENVSFANVILTNVKLKFIRRSSPFTDAIKLSSYKNVGHRA